MSRPFETFVDSSSGTEYILVYGHCHCHVWPLAHPMIYGSGRCGRCGIGIIDWFQTKEEAQEAMAKDGYVDRPF